MEQTLPTYEQRMDAARERLRVALAPETGPEKVHHHVAWSVGRADERAIKRARATGYDHGYHERGASR